MMSLKHMPGPGPGSGEGSYWAAAYSELREVVWLVAMVGSLSVAGVTLAVVLGWSLSMI